VAAHVDVRQVVEAPPEAVWRAANDPSGWSSAGHPVQDLERVGDRVRFRVTTPPTPQGQSWTYTVERAPDEAARTVYSRRIGSPDFRYCHVWFAYEPLGEATEMRCVLDFEMTPASRLGDEEMAAVMERGLRANMAATARAIERAKEDRQRMSGTRTARQLVDEAWSAIERGDIERLGDLFVPDAEMFTTSGSGAGIDHIKAVFTRHTSGYPDIRHEVLDAVESAGGDAVALEIVFTATHGGELRGPFGTIAPTGKRLRWRSSDHVRARDGRIVSWHAHFDRLALLDQLDQLPARPPAGNGSGNKAVLRRMLKEVFEEGRLEVLDEVLTGDFVNHRTPPGVDSGIGGLRMIVGMERAGFPDLRYTVEREVEEGDFVVQVTTVEGTHQGHIFGVAPTGRRVSWRQVHIIRMRDGRMAEHWGVSDLASLWVQIGRVQPLEAVGGAGR
jgi:predicted ester cyclase